MRVGRATGALGSFRLTAQCLVRGACDIERKGFSSMNLMLILPLMFKQACCGITPIHEIHNQYAPVFRISVIVQESLFKGNWYTFRGGNFFQKFFFFSFLLKRSLL